MKIGRELHEDERRGDAEADRIAQAVEFRPELGGLIRPACRPAIERVEQHREEHEAAGDEEALGVVAAPPGPFGESHLGSERDRAEATHRIAQGQQRRQRGE